MKRKEAPCEVGDTVVVTGDNEGWGHSAKVGSEYVVLRIDSDRSCLVSNKDLPGALDVIETWVGWGDIEIVPAVTNDEVQAAIQSILRGA